jgi:hypothetical protein
LLVSRGLRRVSEAAGTGRETLETSREEKRDEYGSLFERDGG